DCHGSIRERTKLRTSSFAAPPGGSDLALLRTPWGKRRFEVRGERVIQRSMVNEDKEWEIIQVLDSITPGSHHYRQQSRLAKTIRKDGVTWGRATREDSLAHSNSRMTCYACHSSWMTSC